MLIEPILSSLTPFFHLVGKETKYPTFDRKSFPLSQPEQELVCSGVAYQSKYLKLNKSGGPNIYFQTWWNHNEFPNPKADILYVHGLGDHGGVLASKCQPFLDAGYRVHAIDLPGHGRSEGLHGYVNSIESLTDSIKLVVQEIKSQFQCNKFYLIGISMGGLASVTYALKFENDIDGLIAVCPAIAPNVKVIPPKPLLMISRFVNLVVPGMILGATKVSRTNKVSNMKENSYKKNIKDHLKYLNPPRLNTGLAIIDGSTEIKDKLRLFNKDLLIQLGSEDQSVDNNAIHGFYKEASSKDKSIIDYKGLGHELHGHTSPDKVIYDAIDWLNKRV